MSSLLLICLVFSTNQLNADQPYVGEIKIFAGNFPPNGWMFCDGQLLSISENEVLFQLIGTTYGGDGQMTFALPNLQSRVALHQGNGYILAEAGGVEQISLTVNQIPLHSHGISFNHGKGELVNPASGFPARNAAGANQYGEITPNAFANAQSIAVVGGSQPHENRQPYLVLNYIISLWGIFPSQSKSGGEEYLVLEPDGAISEWKETRGIEPFLSEIKIFAFNFAPKGWALCNGQLLPINQNQALFALLGTTYGGNGQTNFALPDLRGRVAVHYGNGIGLINWSLGEKRGEHAHTLTTQEMPAHNHLINAISSTGNSNSPADNLLAANSADVPAFSAISSNAQEQLTSQTGGGQAHLNMQPFLTLSYCIALQGIFPSQNRTNDESEMSRGFGDFVAEIIIVPFDFAPNGYMKCDGQIMTISQNTALFSLLGTTYGGDGKSTFGLPDLRGRVAIHSGQGQGLSLYDLGEQGGEESVRITIANMPTHSHHLKVANTATSDALQGNSFGPFPGAYNSGTPNATFNTTAGTISGGSMPHNNIMPSLGLNFIIATQGVFPPRP